MHNRYAVGFLTVRIAFTRQTPSGGDIIIDSDYQQKGLNPGGVALDCFLVGNESRKK